MRWCEVSQNWARPGDTIRAHHEFYGISRDPVVGVYFDPNPSRSSWFVHVETSEGRRFVDLHSHKLERIG